MANYRRNRINEEVQRELNDILRDVKDPRVSDALMTVTAVDVTPDLKFAKVYYSALGRQDEKEVMAGLKSAAGFIRGQVAKRLNLRQTPEFTFVRDRSMENGAHISKLLRSVEADLKDEPETEENL
ncbi:MAG: 30S ribosome-binding factor RbfA [Ruminococcaceae bacterium]|nr:30S ribosome-binding factor RbfA [Oscillospiraceae bacterium]